MSEEIIYCANHPRRETALRCNRCGKPICVSCAVHTPVGYRCRECLRGQQKVFETARTIDLPVGAVIAAICVGLASLVLRYLGFWGLFVAPVVGGGVAEIVRWAVRRRRSRHLALVAACGGALGVLAILLYAFMPWLIAMFAGMELSLSILGRFALSSLWPIVNGALMVSTLYYRLQGIRL